MSGILELSKKGVSSTYRVLDGARGERLAEMRSNGSWTEGSVSIAGEDFRFDLDDATPPGAAAAFIATGNGQRIGTATQMSDEGRRRFIVVHGTTTIELEIHGIGQKPFDATIDGVSAGSVALAGFAGRRALIDLPATVPLGIRLFAGWLALRSWNRAASVRVIPT